ncbi:glycosyltransferase family 87 protein [Crateriforma conspicua]|uniref:glycosyltransferase family 87 protein n=1 Tax=Crateriforma conspicua TaxID=2527996 RepID=UPI0018CF819B|nr:glycosyltransferase family 87 protein [Crateriforma conspicua]
MAHPPSQSKSFILAWSSTVSESASPPDRIQRNAETAKWRVGRPAVALSAGLLLSLTFALTIARIVVQYQTPGPFDASKQGLCDFHNGVYFPAMSLVSGISPYGQDYVAQFPVERPIPFFSPGILVLHAPLTWLPLHAAEAVFTGINLLLLLWIAGVIASQAGWPHRLDALLVIAFAMSVTRSGHVTIFNGYFTLELILATFLAIHWGDRSPWKAAVALAVVSAKPTYILPIGFLLLARGNRKSLIYGAAISVVMAVLPLLWLASHQGDGDIASRFQILLDQIAETQATHRGQVDESPFFSWTRLDLLAVIAKWGNLNPGDATHLGVMGLLLAGPMWVLHRRRKSGIDDGLGGLTGALILVTSLVSVYHQSYDALLLVLPATAVIAALRRPWSLMSPTTRGFLLALMFIPLFNVLSTRWFLMKFDGFSGPAFGVVTGVSGVGLTVLMVALSVLGWPRRPIATPSMLNETAGCSESAQSGDSL